MDEDIKVWVVSGPDREYDEYVFDDARKACQYAVHWIEDIWDQTKVDEPAKGVSIKLRTMTRSEYEELLDD